MVSAQEVVMAKDAVTTNRRREIPFLTPELVDAQGRNDREFLSHQVKLLLEAKDKYPSVSFADISNLALRACGCGCCCCCSTLVLNPGGPIEKVAG
jgi:hypothetical protein